MKPFILILLTLVTLTAEAQIINPNREIRNNRGYMGFRPNHNGLLINQRRPSLSIGMQAAIPTGDFAENYSGTPVGVSGGFYVNMRQTPFDIGITGAWRAAERVEDRVILYTGDDLLGFPTFGSGNVNVQNNQSNIQAAMRFRPFGGRFQVYGEALSGVKSFTTKTKVEIENGNKNTVLSEGRILQSSALSYGWAVGAKYMFTRGLMAEMRFESMMGGTNTYMDMKSVTLPANGEVQYETYTSKTDMYLLHLGISLEF